MDRSIRRYVEHVVSDYPDTKADVASMEAEIVECSLNHDDSGIRGGGVGSPTESKAINLMTNKYLIQLNRNLRAVAKVLDSLPAEKFLLVELKFWSHPQLLSDEGIAQKLGIDRATFYRWKSAIIRAVAVELGLVQK